MMIEVFLLDVNKASAEVVEIEQNDLHKMYELLNCDCIDIAVRSLEGKKFDIVCDDEGLLKDSYKISAIGKDEKPMLVGNLMFAHHDNYGNLTGIDDDDYDLIVRNLALVTNWKDMYPVITGLWY